MKRKHTAIVTEYFLHVSIVVYIYNVYIYYKITYNESDKTHHGIDSLESRYKARMCAQSGDIHSPVASFGLYLSKLSPECDAVFRVPLYPKPNVWYAAQAMNKPVTMMSMISQWSLFISSICTSLYLSHCGYWVDCQSSMSVTWHRNVKSLECYNDGPTEQQKRQTSETLQRVATADSSSRSPMSIVWTDDSSQIAVVTSMKRNPFTDLNIFNLATITGSHKRKHRFLPFLSSGDSTDILWQFYF